MHDVEAAQQLATVTEMAQRVRQPSSSTSREYNSCACAWKAASATPRPPPSVTRAGRLPRGREASGSYGIQMFAIRREQGRLAELARPHGRSLLQKEVTAPGGPPSRRCSPSSGWTRRSSANWRRPPRRARLSAPVALVGVAHLPHRRVQRDRRRERRGAHLPGALPFAGMNLIIGGGVVYGAADRYSACSRRRPDRRSARTPTSPRHSSSTAAWARPRGSRTPVTSTDGCCARAASPSVPGRSSPRPRLSRSGSGCQRWSPASGASAWRARRRRFPHGLTEREADVLCLVAWALESRDRGGALDQRAHRRQPRQEHPPQDRLREPDRAASYAYRRD